VAQELYQHTFANGLTLLAERLPHVRSAAVHFNLPAGCGYDPTDRTGLANLVVGLLERGAGNLDSRELTDALDRLGLDRSESVGAYSTRLAGATLARYLPDVLARYADMIRRPHLPADELEPVKALAVQELQSIEDEPQQQVLLELNKRHYPPPLNRDYRGTLAGIDASTSAEVQQFWQQHYQPQGAILAVAGDVQWQPLLDCVGELFGTWSTTTPVPPLTVTNTPPQSAHLTKELEQTQISLAFDTVTITDPLMYQVRGAVGVLSQGMSSRLFSEVREKHGLCYAVYASYESFKERGSIVAYAGSRPEKAQETLERTLHELRRLKEGIAAEEVARVQAGLKSALVMRQESTSARAGAIASDWFYLGRVRPLREVQAAIDGLTPASILDFLHQHPLTSPTVVTLGTHPLTVPS
jgi:predicted Zn-dependent peptidase